MSPKLDQPHIDTLHSQHTSEYLILHYLGLLRLSSSILLQFKWDVEKPEGPAEELPRQTIQSK